MNDGHGKVRTKPKAVVIGGSMAGLFAALLLRRAGWQVDVYERIGAELAGRGAGIVTHRELFDVLAKAGIDTAAAALGVSVPGRRVLDRDGRVAGELALPQVLTSWGRLYGMLKDAIPANCYHHGQNLVEVTEHSDRVVARFADGTRGLGRSADWRRWNLLQRCGRSARPMFALSMPDTSRGAGSSTSRTCRRGSAPNYAIGSPSACRPASRCSAIPLPEPTKRWASVSADSISYGTAPPMPIIGWLICLRIWTAFDTSCRSPRRRIRAEIVAAMRRDAERLLAPQFAEVVRLTSQPFIQAILDLETPRMVLGARTVILGDAAFVARPHVGMGVTKAAADTMALVDALQTHPTNLQAALAQFESARVPFGAAVVRRARHLGSYMQAQIATPRRTGDGRTASHP